MAPVGAGGGARREEIVLIGPLGVGKSTIGRRLAARGRLPQVSADALGHGRYTDLGCDPAQARAAWQEAGPRGFYRYMGPFLVRVVEQLVAEHRHCVIDLGAGHTHHEDPRLFRRVRRALAPFAHVVLLLPSPDLDASVRVLRRRRRVTARPEWQREGYDVLAHWVKDDCNHALATLTVYTEKQSPAATCEEILRRVYAPPARPARRGAARPA